MVPKPEYGVCKRHQGYMGLGLRLNDQSTITQCASIVEKQTQIFTKSKAPSLAIIQFELLPVRSSMTWILNIPSNTLIVLSWIAIPSLLWDIVFHFNQMPHQRPAFACVIFNLAVIIVVYRRSHCLEQQVLRTFPLTAWS